MSKQTVKVEISFTSLLIVIGTIAGLWLLFLLREILLLIFIAFIIASALGPVLRALRRRHVPQFVSLASTFLLIVGIVVLIGFMVIPALYIQIENFLLRLPDIVGRAAEIVAGSEVDQVQVQQYISRAVDELIGSAGTLSTNVVQVGLGIFSGFISAVTVVVMSFYFIAEREQLYNAVSLLMPHHTFIHFRQVAETVEHKLGSWLRGQLLLGLIISVTTWVGLVALGLQQYALPLAIIAGVLELIPIIGPILAAIPAVIIALTISPTLAIGVILLYLLIQQLESHLIVPKVMERAVGLNPLLVIIALLAGGALMGILGALLAVPLAVVIATILQDIRDREAKQH